MDKESEIIQTIENSKQKHSNQLIKKDLKPQKENKKLTNDARLDINDYKTQLEREDKMPNKIRDSEAVRIMKHRAEQFKELQKRIEKNSDPDL